MKQFKYIFSVTFILLTFFSVCKGGVNEWCPVEPERKAKLTHSADYKGATIYFCCSSCIDDFTFDPSKYTSNLPAEVEQKITGASSKSSSLISLFNSTEPRGKYSEVKQLNIAKTLMNTVIITFILLGLCYLLRSFFKKLSREGRRIKIYLMTLGCGMVFLIVFSTMLLIQNRKLYAFGDWTSKELRNDANKDLIHYATFYEYGNPIETKNPKEVPSLSSIFYRGNDERSPELYNNGFYRTSTFTVSLKNGDDEKLDYKEKVDLQHLYIDLVIERAPHTPDRFFSKELMSKMFVTTNCEPFAGVSSPIDDEVKITIIEPNQKFRFKIPLNLSKNKGDFIFYLREKRYKSDKLIGSRIHYAIQGKVIVSENNLILPESDIWIGATYRTRRLRNWEIPSQEWFSLKPIPEKPEGDTVMDDELSGIREQNE